MHPPLSEHLHAGCEKAIRGLKDCHAAHPLRKFVGACNFRKTILDACLADEYLVRRELNSQKSEVDKQKLKAYLRENDML
jgi:Cytochrome c oxidase biogenesis protein Cmc1 like